MATCNLDMLLSLLWFAATSDVIEAALPTLVQYVSDQFQSGFVVQFEVVPDASSTRAAEVILQ